MAIIATPNKEPDVAVQYSADMITLARSTLKLVLRCQQLLSTALLFLLVRTYLGTSQILCGTGTIAMQACSASQRILFNTVVLSGQTASALWNSRSVKRLRKKVEFEFFTLILGSGGNNCFLMVFWPGWWFLGFVGLMVWAWAWACAT